MKYEFISQANAQEAAPAPAAGEFSFTSFVPLILIFAVFYFLIIRPQSKKMKEQQALVNALKIGDKVITNSGIFGTVREILEKENALEIEVASGVTIKILRNFVVDLVKKDEDKKSKK